VKRTFGIVSSLVLIGALCAPAAAVAQQERPPLVGLKIDLVVSRQAGDKKVSSLPYSLWVTANEQRVRTTSLRVGSQVPVASTRVPEKDSPAPPAYSYRDIGTNIDCSASSAGEGRFSVHIVLNDSSVHTDAKESRSVPGLPVFRNFSSSFALLLKDGQSATYTSAADPVSGETMKVDVTLTVLK
jgi:hypothetical protein